MDQQTIMSGAAICSAIIIALIALRAWQDWLALKTQELDRRTIPTRELEGGSTVGAARIEIADLKERIRKLEAIASGVDL